MHEKQRSDELRKYLKQVAMGPNEAAAQYSHLTWFVTWPRDPSPSELTKRHNARYGELHRSQEKGCE